MCRSSEAASPGGVSAALLESRLVAADYKRARGSLTLRVICGYFGGLYCRF